MAHHRDVSQKKLEPLVLNSCNAGNMTLTGPIALNSCNIDNLTVTGQIALNCCKIQNLTVTGPIALNGCKIGNLSVTGRIVHNNDCKIQNLTVRAVPKTPAAGSATRPNKQVGTSSDKHLKYDNNKHGNGSGAANDKKVKERHHNVKGKPKETIRHGDAKPAVKCSHHHKHH